MRILWAARVLPSIAAFTICLLFLPGKSEGSPAFYPDSGSYNNEYDKLATLVRLVEKAKAQPRQISGQVSLRPPRSELVGDMAHALRLYQLQELDRMYGAKSRPRFGKRSGMSQDEVAVYGNYDATNNVIPEDHDEDQDQNNQR